MNIQLEMIGAATINRPHRRYTCPFRGESGRVGEEVLKRHLGVQELEETNK